MNVTISSNYFRLSGLALLLGGLMGGVGQLLHAGDTPETVAEIPGFVAYAVNTHVLLAWASTLILLGLPAIYLRQAAKLKWWGWLGLPLLFIALMFEIFHGPLQIMGYPIIFHNVTTPEQLQVINDQIHTLATDQYPLQLAVLIPLMPFLFIGLILTAVGMLTARVLPKHVGVVLTAAITLLVLGMFIKIRVLDVSFSYLLLAFAYIGGSLLLGSSNPAEVTNASRPARSA
ncbi:hypothetical protein ACFFK0_16155 [Paenibacillus chartarius]|uniref:DUF4386 domain-containing protein n=1 Tax=Paenibacillus chartarius TaxID=747481 RepID=A0ABV6DMU1_9BACL